MTSPNDSVSHPQLERPDLNGMEDQMEALLNVIELDRRELVELEDTVSRAFQAHEEQNLASDPGSEAASSFGEVLADKVASFGGSWAFIILFAVVLAAWITVNLWVVSLRFDPYPFIFLNLILSCIAAVQAPIIMMSQNRQEARDRLRAQHDYRVNLKAELEIRELHDKMDHLLYRQMQRLLEIQRLQVQMLNELRSGPGTPNGPNRA